MDLFDCFVPTEDGYFVSEKQARVAEILSDYDPTIRLAWIPPDKREPGDKPFAVIKREESGHEYAICYADECDERLLERVWSMDSSKHDILAVMDARNAAIKALELKKQMEEMEEAHDLSASILRSPLNTYRHNGVTYQ